MVNSRKLMDSFSRQKKFNLEINLFHQKFLDNEFFSSFQIEGFERMSAINEDEELETYTDFIMKKSSSNEVLKSMVSIWRVKFFYTF